jgi:Putative Zn-dependent protease, contains TPR repeats
MRAQGNGTTGLNIAFSPDSRVLAIGQTDAPLRLADPATGADYAEFAHPDLKRARVVAFSPDQTQLVTMPIVDESPAFVWDLAAIRRELARRGLDWPANVLRERSSATPRDNEAELTVTLDDGGLLVRQQALEILRQAANVSPSQKIELYRRAIDVDPTCGTAHNNLAWLLATGPEELRKAPDSLECARRATDLEPDNSTFLNTLGVALYRNGQYKEAIAVLERSLSANRERAGAYDLLFLALCHHALGKQELARQKFAEAAAWFASRRARLSPAWVEELTRLLDEANVITSAP